MQAFIFRNLFKHLQECLRISSKTIFETEYDENSDLALNLENVS
jgi:hypothetical protein